MKMSIRALALLVTLAALDAHAQATRTWLSGVGDDANPCSRTAPCKTLAGALAKTAAGGVIDALDRGGWGAATITKSITINSDAFTGGITATSGTTAITINAAATDKVILRGLNIDGAGSGLDGIKVKVAGTVSIEGCRIVGFTSDGVELEATMTGNVWISDSTLQLNGTGLNALGGQVVINRSKIAGNTAAGLDVSGASTFVTLTNSDVLMNDIGIRTANDSKVRLSQNSITGNTTYAWQILTGSVIETHKDNRARGTGSGTLTPVTAP